MRKLVSVGATACALLVTAPAFAGAIDLSSLTNANIQNYTGGWAYPQSGNTVSINGVDFTISSVGGNVNSTGVIQLGGVASSDIAVNEGGVHDVYVLLNSSAGTFGADIGSLTFHSGGHAYTVDLVEGTNVRDHYNGGYNNIASDAYGTASYYTGVRLDAYRYALPGSFGGALDSITFASNSNSSWGGAPFLAAVTTATTGAVPEPASWAMMLGGFGAIGGALLYALSARRGRHPQSVPMC